MISKSLRLVVLVSGRGSNLQALIDASVEKKINSKIVAVISNKAEAKALERARKASIPAVTLASKGKPNDVFFSELTTEIKKHKPDLIVLAGFMKIIPSALVDEFAGRMINIHPSLLPNFPGLNAQKQAIEAHAQKTGCTVHVVDHGCDTGPILLQNEIEILKGDTEDSLSKRLLAIEHQTLVAAIKLIEDDKLVLQRT